MARTEAKLELLKQIRMEQNANLRDLQHREHLLYGKTYSYPEWREEINAAEKTKNSGFLHFMFRCLLTFLLCTGIYYVFQQQTIIMDNQSLLLNQEQTSQLKETMKMWLTKNDLSFDEK